MLNLEKNNNKNNDDVNINSLYDNFREDLFNQFTNKEELPCKKKYNKKDNVNKM